VADVAGDLSLSAAVVLEAMLKHLAAETQRLILDLRTVQSIKRDRLDTLEHWYLLVRLILTGASPDLRMVPCDLGLMRD
jgi:hypothetical protein